VVEAVIVKKLITAMLAKMTQFRSPILRVKIDTETKGKHGAKKSQPGVKKRIRKNKQCNSMGCTNFSVKGGVCITHGAKHKRCSFEGCTNGARKRGVCVTHGEKSGINTNNNSTLVSSANVTPPILPHQSIDSDEEELNSWIWKSCRIPKYCASKKCN
jgi:hypothetical protein